MTDGTIILHGEPPSFAYLFWTSGVRRGESVTLKATGSTVGRRADAEVVLDDAAVSAEQARIRREDDAWWLYDLASTNTTRVGDVPITRHQLSDRDRLTFGETTMTFRLVG